MLRTLLLRARPARRLARMQVSDSRSLGPLSRAAQAREATSSSRKAEGGERQGGAGPEDALAGRQGGAWRGEARRPRTFGRAAGAHAAGCVRVAAALRSVRYGRAGSGSEAPRVGRGGKAGRRGRPCSARSDGLGELCPLSPRRGRGPGSRVAAPLLGRAGRRAARRPGERSGPPSCRAPGRGGPRRSPVPRARAAATAAAPARPRGVSRAAGPAQVTPSSARPRPAPPAARPPPPPPPPHPGSGAALTVWSAPGSGRSSGQGCRQARRQSPAARPGPRPAPHPRPPVGCPPAAPTGGPPRPQPLPRVGRPRRHHESPLLPAVAAPPRLRRLLGRREQLAVSPTGTGLRRAGGGGAGRPAGVSAAGREAGSRSPPPAALGAPLLPAPLPARRRQGWRQRCPHPEAAWGAGERAGCGRGADPGMGLSGAGCSPRRADRSPRKSTPGRGSGSQEQVNPETPRTELRAPRCGLGWRRAETCSCSGGGSRGRTERRDQGTGTQGRFGSPRGRKEQRGASEDDSSPLLLGV